MVWSSSKGVFDMAMEFIGFGGTSNVYKKNGVALKQFKAGQDEKFEHEKELLLRLAHPNIIKCYGTFRWDKTSAEGKENNREVFGLVLELGEKNLHSCFIDNKTIPFDEETRKLFAYQLVTALAYLHFKRIVHRDVQISNMVVCNGGSQVKLVDFGSAAEFTAGEDVCYSYTKIVFSTGAYTAPEIRNEKLVPGKGLAYGPATDAYAFGKVLWGLITNSTAFEYPEEVEQPKRPENYSNDLYWGVMQRFWSQKPAERLTPQYMLTRRPQLEKLFSFGK